MQDDIKVHYKSLDILRLVLMFFVCINNFGFTGRIGVYIQILSNFAPVAFFVISGFLVLGGDKEHRHERIAREIKRAAITFLGLFVFNIIVNSLFYYFAYNITPIQMLAAVCTKRTIFEFLVLNQWPLLMGTLIWYVQALLYAYIFIYILDKLHLMWCDTWIAVFLLLFGICTGELAVFFNFNIAGYTYISSNFLTRAIPYILIGGVIERNIDDMKEYSSWIYFIIGLGGLFLGAVEMIWLNNNNALVYYYHNIGSSIFAVMVCILAFMHWDFGSSSNYFATYARKYTTIIYFLCHPVGVLSCWLFQRYMPSSFNYILPMASMIAFALPLLIATVICLMIDTVKDEKTDETEHEEEYKDEAYYKTHRSQYLVSDSNEKSYKLGSVILDDDSSENDEK